MKVIVVASNKGGVTKTTTAAHIAAHLGERAATLLMDFDSQGQAAMWFGKDPQSAVFDWLTGVRTLENCVMAAREQGQLWLLLGNSRTKIIEKMHRELSREQYDRFVAAIRALADNFEFVIIDTPSAGVLQEVALGAADHVVVPFRAEVPGVRGADDMLSMLRAMRVQAQITLLPADFFARVSEQNRCLSEFSDAVPQGMMAPLPVPHRTAVTEAVAEGLTAFEYKSRSLTLVRAAYAALCTQLVGPGDADLVESRHAYDLLEEVVA